jgi:hypothetical protein
VNFIDLPNIGNGTAEEQLAQIRSYIYRNNEQLNATLANLSVDKMWEQTASALSASNGDVIEVNKDLMSRYATIRDLVIKTADVVIQSDEKFTSQMNGNYVAISDFGKYLRDTTLDISGSSVGIEYLYNYASQLETDLDNYKVNQTSYIKQGLLDESGASPIYGVEVGLLSDSFEYNGKVIDTRSNLKTRITPTEMSWWAENKKLFYLDKDSVYFPYAKITGGSINIGNGTFTVDSFGNVNAISGTIGGLDITALTDMAMGIDIRPNATLVRKTATEGYSVPNISVTLSSRNVEVASTKWYISSDGEVWTQYTQTAMKTNMIISSATAFKNSSVLYVKAESKDSADKTYIAVCSIGCVSDGVDGTSFKILGSAYKETDEYITTVIYDIYYDADCTKIINSTTTTLSNGDSYIINGYLFVYDTKYNAFVCTGEIKGKDGKNGTDAQAYEIYTDVSSVNKNILGTSCTPSTINIEFRQNSGGNTQLVTASEIRVWRINGNKSVFYKSKKNTNNFILSLSGEFNAYISTCTAIKIEVSYNNKVYTKTIPLIVSAEEIKAWAKVENGQTVIDGAKIYTGSITAEKIDIAYRNTLATGEQLTTAISNVNDSISAWASKIDSNTTDIANLTVKSNEISSTVTQKTSTSTIQSIIRQSANAVEFAWSESKLGNVIRLEDGDINFYYFGKKMSSVSQYGQSFWRDNLSIGYIGATAWKTAPSIKGLAINLDKANGKFIAFGYESGDSYETQLAFAKNNAIGNDNEGVFCYANFFGGNTFNSGWSTIRRFWLRDVSVEMGLRTKDNRNGQLYNTVTADIPYIRTIKSGSNGSITWTYSTLKVVNGLITSY